MKSSNLSIATTLNVVAISLVLILIGCTPRSTNDPGVPLERLKEKIISSGDEDAYEKLGIAYLDYNKPQEVMIYSTIMANKFRSPEAYYYVYHDLVSVHSNGLADMGEDLRTIAIQHLKKSASLKYLAANDELGELYLEGKYLPKDTLLGKKLKKYGEKQWDKKTWYYDIFN